MGTLQQTRHKALLSFTSTCTQPTATNRRAMSKIDIFREKLLHRSGSGGIKSLGRQFRIYDDDGSKTLTLEEFVEGVNDFGLNFSSDETSDLFAEFDKDGSGTISFDEFLVALRGNLNGSRMGIVEQAFKKADRSGDGVFDAMDMKKVYKATEHPK